jgi:hypothetical protein
MSIAALQLSRIPEVARNVVIDKTGLSGNCSFSFDWSAKKLEPTKAPVDFLVIDDVQRPSEN